MASSLIAAGSAGLIFAGALLGMGLQRLLPGKHLGKEMQDVVKLSAGMIATLTALVLGLLVSSAKNSFDTVNGGIVQTSAKVILLDRALSHYGPETRAARDQVKSAVAALVNTIWPSENTGASALSTIEHADGVEIVQQRLSELQPQNDAQRESLAQAKQILGDLTQTRWLLIEQEQNELPVPLLVILVFWLALLFASFGLFAPTNVTAFAVLFVGTCAASAAIFLVVEMNQPVDGLIKISSAPMRNALKHIDQ
jgi:hypothetical protein